MRSVIFFLTLLTGFSGLVYEVAWQKCLAILLGSHSEATAAVLAIFLGGLSLGYSIFGRLAQRRANDPRRLLGAYGVIEASIGFHALLFPWLFELIQWISLAMPPLSQGQGFAVDVVLTILLIGPPTVLMGGTIPILTQTLARDLGEATRIHAFVYAFNTAGATGGALAAGFVLVPWLGIDGVIRMMGLVNLIAGASFLIIAARSFQAQSTELVAPEPKRARGFALYLWVVVLLGFAMMSAQTVLIRVGGLAFGASHFTFSMVVSVFVLCLALGSFAVSWLGPRLGPGHLVASIWLLAASFVVLHLVLEDAPYWAHRLRTYFDSEAFYGYYFSAFAALLVILAVPVCLSGASLPLLFHHLRDSVDELGAIAGRLYSFNTVGNLLGALLGGYALLFWLDLHQIHGLAIASITLAAVLLSNRIAVSSRTIQTSLFAIPVLVYLLLPTWDPARLSSGVFRNRSELESTRLGPDAFFAEVASEHIAFVDDDPTTSVVVKEQRHSTGISRSIVTNGKTDGTAGINRKDYPTMALAGLLPCLLAERCERAFVIGFGTGVTAGELAALESMELIRVSEISRGVLEAAPLFDFANLEASSHPKVRLERSDAYRALLRSEGDFDVIVSEPSNPWVSGVEMLFSREFLEAAKGRLRPGGIYSQWFHSYETNDETLALVLRTYAEVFGRVSVWYTNGPDLLVLAEVGGRSSDHFDMERLERRAQRADFRAGLLRCGIRSLPALLVHELLPVGVVKAIELSGPVHTLRHPRLSHLAARAFYEGGNAELPWTGDPGPARIGAANALLNRLGERAREEREVVVGQACASMPRQCAVLLAQWLSDDVDSGSAREVLARHRHRSGLEEHLTDLRLAELRLLLGDSTIAVSELTPEGLRATFETYYHHLAPFDRDLSACRGASCESLRRGLESYR